MSNLEWDVKIIHQLSELTNHVDHRLSSLSECFSRIQSDFSKTKAKISAIGAEFSDAQFEIVHDIEQNRNNSPIQREENSTEQMTSEKMNEILRILAKHQRLENENFEIFRVGTAEFDQIGEDQNECADDDESSHVIDDEAARTEDKEDSSEGSHRSHVTGFSDVSSAPSTLATTPINTPNTAKRSVVTGTPSTNEEPITFPDSSSNSSASSIVDNREMHVAPRVTKPLNSTARLFAELRQKTRKMSSSSSDEERMLTERPRFLNKARVRQGPKRRPPTRPRITSDKNVNEHGNFQPTSLSTNMDTWKTVQHVKPTAETKSSAKRAQNVASQPKSQYESSDIDTDELFE